MQKVSDNMRWIDVSHTLQLPDIAGLVRDRLHARRGLSSDIDTSELGKMFVRQLEEGEAPSTGGLRLSSAGKCKRALAYDYHHYVRNGFEGDASAPLVFAIGDIVEMIVVVALREATVGTGIKTYYTGLNQKTVSLSVPLDHERTARVAGHPDGIMKVPAYRKDLDEYVLVNVVLEVKSMSDYAFKKFRTSGLDKEDQYNYQAQAYQMSLNQETGEAFDWTYMIAFGKSVTAKDCVIREDGSHYKLWPIVGKYIASDEDVKDDILDRLRDVINSENPEDFPRIQDPSTQKKKKGQLGFPCDWCSHWRTCWPTAYEEPVQSGWFQRTTKIKLKVGE